MGGFLTKLKKIIGSDRHSDHDNNEQRGHQPVMTSDPNVRLLGVYRVEDTDEDVHLFELLIDASPKDVNVGAILQKDPALRKDNWQVAYDERYLNEDGTEVIGDYFDRNELKGDRTRITFFLYFVDFNKPLTTQYGDIILPPAADMPERLSEIIEFEPVD